MPDFDLIIVGAGATAAISAFHYLKARG